MGWLPVLTRSLLSPAGVTLLSSGLALGVGVVAFRERPDPMARPLVVLMSGIALWTLSGTAGYLAAEPRLELLFVRVQSIGGTVVPVAYLFVALRYAGYDDLFRRRVYAATGVVPVLSVVLVWTNGLHNLVWVASTGPPNLPVSVVLDYGPWFWVMVGYSYLVVVAGLVVFVKTALDAGPLHRRQSALVLAGGLVPLVANVGELTGAIPSVPTGLTPPALTVSGLTFAVALFRHDFLNRPSAAYRNVSSIFGDGVLVFDEHCRLVDANDGAGEILQTTTETGTDAADVLPEPLDTIDGTVLSRTEDRRQFYRVRHEQLTDQQGQVAGHVVAMREVTDLKEHKQRLEVANRILRHNLRNELNIILGHAARLESTGTDGTEELTSIREAAERLNDLGRKARHLQSSLSWDDAADRPVSLGVVLERVVSEHRDAYPEATITVDGTQTAPVCAPDASVVETIVDNLLQNALEHGDGTPHVRISVGADTDTVTLEIADDGPGIPPGELEALAQGSETELEHGSGIGLWLVHWFVSSMGGEVSFRHADGTVVEVTLRRADDAPATAGEPGLVVGGGND